MRQIIAVGIGGFIGAATRYVLVRWIHSLPSNVGFPYGTLAVNVLGSFLLGLLIAAAGYVILGLSAVTLNGLVFLGIFLFAIGPFRIE